MDNQVQTYNDGNGSQGIVMQRHDELTRLFGKYAISNEAIESYIDKNGDSQPGLLDMTPRVKVETLDGEVVNFPGLRPDMLPFPVPNINEHAVDADSKQVTDRLRAENADLAEKQRQLEERLDALYAERAGADTASS